MRPESVLLAALLLLFALPAEAQRNCRKGIPCGNSCIAANKTCRIGSSSPRPAPEPSRTEIERQPLTLSAPSTARHSVAVTEALQGIRYVGSALDVIYYPIDCKAAAHIHVDYRVYFQSEDAARVLKYRRSTDPC